MAFSFDEPMELTEFKHLSRQSVDKKDEIESLEIKIRSKEKRRKNYREVMGYLRRRSASLAFFIGLIFAIGFVLAFIMVGGVSDISRSGNEAFFSCLVMCIGIWLIMALLIFVISYMVLKRAPQNIVAVERAIDMDIYELEDLESTYQKCKEDGMWKLHDEWMKFVYKLKILRKKEKKVPEYDYIIFNILIDSLPDRIEEAEKSVTSIILDEKSTPRDYMLYAYEKCEKMFR